MTARITQKNLKNGVVAFIDLLGFSARVEAISTEVELRALDNKLAFVQAEFEHKSSDNLIRQSHKITRKTVTAFSDCIIISVPIRSPLADHQGAFDVLMSEFTGFAIAQGTCVLHGTFLRAGIDLGFWYRRKDSLISPPLVRAHKLEHDACVPMMAITPQLRKYLAGHRGRRSYSTDIDPIPRTLRQYRKLPNGKTQWFINYVRICLDSVEGVLVGEERDLYKSADADGRERIRTEAWQRACRDWAHAHARAVLRAYSAARSPSVRAKYSWLAEYHNAEIERFFGSGAQQLLVKLDQTQQVTEEVAVVKAVVDDVICSLEDDA